MKMVELNKDELEMGDYMTAEEFRGCVGAGLFTYDDGSGNWCTETELSDVSCWTIRPEWATHVMWYNK